MVTEMSNNTTSNPSQKTITLSSLLTTALRYWRILIPIIIVCFAISTVYSMFVATPMYSSTAKLYIVNKSSQNGQVSSTDFNISTYLTHDFAEILVDDIVISDVADELNNKYSVNTIKGFLDVEAPKDTRIIEIRVLSPNAKDSKKIADSICRVSQEKLVEIMGLDRVKVIREGSIAKRPSSPNVTKDAITGFLVGIILAVGVTYIISLTDNKISSSEDVEKIIGINVLTTIPYNDSKRMKR